MSGLAANGLGGVLLLNNGFHARLNIAQGMGMAVDVELILGNGLKPCELYQRQTPCHC
jgi:hypothetical protein